MTVDQFGHWLSDVLRKNSSSWLHYNLASIYWRVKGNVPKALECSRRAVHYAPRQFKNIALLCLGSILHRSKHSDDATVVLGAAVDHDPGFPISHFALGGALAVSGDFNSSLKHLDLSMKLHTKFDLAEKFRNGVLCHLDMFKKMQIAQSTLKELSIALGEYSETENQWLNLESNCVKMAEITRLKIKELKKDGDRNSLVQYFIDSPTYNEEWMKETGVSALDTAQSLQRIIKHIGRHAGLPTKKSLASEETSNRTDIIKEIGPMPSFPDMFPDPKRCIYPSNFKVNRNKETFDTDPDWPSNRFCKEAAPRFPEHIEAVYPKLASKWVLFTVASLYWRVRGNIPYALNCLLTASRTADTRYRDVVLVSLASVFMEMGLLDECSNHAEEAYKMSPYEPATNFVLAQLSMIKKNQKAHMFHLKQAIRVEGRFMGGAARHVLNGWACILKQVNTLMELGDAIFDKFVDAMPSDRTNKVAHQKNYDVMMKTVFNFYDYAALGSKIARYIDTAIQTDRCQRYSVPVLLLVAKEQTCLHISMCLMLFGDTMKKNSNETPS
ncbi:Tetratricopeptide repeat protein 17 [Operophtera brumata]|uniref:Tetratricopeptide repeat protein 17 n=1 Tax=Operophtera brumata TaxID=104452 RepID=A0A0L7LJP1_OPEBR|nr:Tetratricopeptide repeat protein 17 [Operophtera brumata]